jgi:hypothetical protein
VRSKVPDQAKGGSGRCTRCSNFFTLTPAEDQRIPELVGSPLEPSSSDLEPAGASAASGTNAGWDADIPDDAADEKNGADAEVIPSPGVAKTEKAANAAQAAECPEAEETPAVWLALTVPDWVYVPGAVAFILGSVALLAAPFDAVRFLTIPAAGIGLFIVAVALLRMPANRQFKDYLWLSVGGVVSGAVLATAAFAPTSLNRNWGRDFRVPQEDPLQMFLMSRDGRVTGTTLKDGDTVDASKHAIRQADVHIVVEKVALDVPPAKGPDKTRQISLLVTMRLTNTSKVRQFLYERTKMEPTLRDERGKTYALRTFAPDLGVEKQVAKEFVNSNRRMEDLLIFETPDPDVTQIDLELSAASWGAKGKVIFRIPREMYASSKLSPKR